MGNKGTWFNRNEKKIVKISFVIIFLALIRCISEFFRLDYTLGEKFNVEIAKPFIIGALVSAISAFIMVLLYFFSKHKLILAAAIIAIVLMLIIKKVYSIE